MLCHPVCPGATTGGVTGDPIEHQEEEARHDEERDEDVEHRDAGLDEVQRVDGEQAGRDCCTQRRAKEAAGQEIEERHGEDSGSEGAIRHPSGS